MFIFKLILLINSTLKVSFLIFSLEEGAFRAMHL